MKAAALGGGAIVLAACAPAAPAAPAAAVEVEVTRIVEVAGPTAIPAPEAAAPAAEPVTIRLSAWGDVTDAKVYESISTAVNELNSNVRTSVEQYPGGYYEKIQANFAANVQADVLYMQGWRWQAFAESKVLVDLTDYIDRDGAQEFFPGGENYENQTMWQGARYMTPTDTGSLVIYYNKDLFDKKGMAYPQAGWKWEEFQKMIEDLSYEEGGKKFYGWGQAQGWNGGYGRSTTFMRRNGHMEWDRITEPTKAIWDHPDIVSALQFMVYDTIANGWSPGPAVVEGGGVGLDTGRVAMYLEGPWVMARLKGELASTPEGINFDVIAAPTGTANQNFTFGHIHGHVITAGSPYPEQAWEVVKFILGQEGQTLIANGGRMCGRPDNIQNIWGGIASKQYGFTNTAAFADTMRESSVSCLFGAGTELGAYGGGPLSVLWDKLLAQTETAEQAIKIANADIQTMLDQYWKDRA